jgi:radical SAM protein with 4Fe4S-binding SPASM domain
MRIDISDRPQRLVPAISGKFDANWGGQFFAEVVSLSSGAHTAKVQIIFSEFSNGEEITIRVRSLSRLATLAETKVKADLGNRRSMDEIYLSFSLPEYDDVEISGHCTANCSTTVLRYITIVDGEGSDPEKFLFDDIGTPRIADIKVVNFGTTGVCNASCMHCPTNKDFRKMPHGRMSMELFNKIIAELKDNGFSGEIRFGLFAEPLDDPLLKQRLEIIKNELPATAVSIATNCGLFDEKRHGFILDYANFIGVHVESVDPDVYNAYMDPLKADRVIPRVLSLLELAVRKGRPDAVGITTPVHKGNLAGLPKLYDFFSKYRSGILLTSLSNRCWEEGPYTKLSLAPFGGYCLPHFLHDDLFIDWDGALVPCCFDFSKSMTLGDLNTQSLQEVFRGEAWQAQYETFRGKRWSEKGACSRCRVDHHPTVQKYVAPFITTHTPEREFSPIAFSANEPAIREEDGNIVVPEEAPDGIAIYGPYVRLPPGRYRIYSRIEVESFSKGTCYLELDVNADMKATVTEGRAYITELGPVVCPMEFALDRDALLEFRVRKVGPVRFRHSGAVVLSLAGSSEATPVITPVDSAESTTTAAERREFAAANFPFASGARLTENGYVIADASVADGNVIFGPYVRLPAGRYRVHPRVEVLDCVPGKSLLDLDVNADVHRVVVANRVELAQTGPIACTLDFALDHETLVEFRVGKEGPVEFRFFGMTLWTFDQFKVLGEEIGTSGRDFPLHLFSITDLATREPGREAGGVIACPPRSGDGNVIYGPYQPIRAGRYRVEHRIDIDTVPQETCWIELDVNSAQGPIVAAKRIKVYEQKPLRCSLDFVLARDDIVEFRVSRHGRIGFVHTGISVRALRDEEALETGSEEQALDPDNLDFGDAGTVEIPPGAFSIAGLSARDTPTGFISDPQSANGNIIYGPYVRVPAGRYSVQPHIAVQTPPAGDAHLVLDVYAADTGTIVSTRRINIANQGPLDCRLDFRLEDEARLEFRVYKEGPIGFSHSGAMLRTLREDELSDSAPGRWSFNAESPTFDATGVVEIPSSAFAIVAQMARDAGAEIIAEPMTTDGNVIYGPYVRVPAGRYRMQPHIVIQEFSGEGTRLHLDVYSADKDSLLAAKRIRITDEGPIGCQLDFVLVQEARLEFRVAKEGHIRFRHAGATLRILPADEPADSAPGGTFFDPEKLGFDRAGVVEIPSSAFSVVARKGHDTGSEILSNPRAADGHVIYGPYARVPAGRYRMRAHIDVEQCPTHGHLLLDVNAADKAVVVAAKRIRITANGPVGCDLEFALESDAQLEFRVSKEGPVAFRHSGVTLQALGKDEPFADP